MVLRRSQVVLLILYPAVLSEHRWVTRAVTCHHRVYTNLTGGEAEVCEGRSLAMPRPAAARAASIGSEGASPFLTEDQRAALDAALAKKKAEEGATASWGWQPS
mgnify:FL=1